MSERTYMLAALASWQMYVDEMQLEREREAVQTQSSNAVYLLQVAMREREREREREAVQTLRSNAVYLCVCVCVCVCVNKEHQRCLSFADA
jgi:hypothetical protein